MNCSNHKSKNVALFHYINTLEMHPEECQHYFGGRFTAVMDWTVYVRVWSSHMDSYEKL